MQKRKKDKSSKRTIWLLQTYVMKSLRFRMKKFALQADIKKAFFTISVNEEDRRYLRFVWPNEHGAMTTYRLMQLPFGVNCSPFIMTAVLRQHLNIEASKRQGQGKLMLELMRDSFYVDDCISSVDSNLEAGHLENLGMSALEGAGMVVRKWRFNSEINDCTQPLDGKVFGVTWHSQADTLSFPINAKQNQHRTKRSLLHSVAILYDSLGMISPYVIPTFNQGYIKMQDKLLHDNFLLRVKYWSIFYCLRIKIARLNILSFLGNVSPGAFSSALMCSC